MSWNKPSDQVAASRQSRKSGGNRKASRAAVASVGVIAVAVLAWLYFSQSDEQSTDKSSRRKPAAIKEVKPAAAPKPVAEAAKPEPDNKPPTCPGILKNGYMMRPNGKIDRVTEIYTAKVTNVSLVDKTFACSSDRSIAYLMTTEPGESFLGASTDYYHGFEKEFKEALKTPIEIKPEDTDEVRELKQAVIDARKELKGHLDAGGDLTKFMQESREQLRELGLYREEISKQVREILANKDDLTDQDIEDLKGAANKMLEDRGAKPLAFEAAFAYQLRMQREAEEEKSDTEETKEEEAK